MMAAGACADQLASGPGTDGAFEEQQVAKFIERFFGAINDYDVNEVETMVSAGSFPSLRSLMLLMEANHFKTHLLEVRAPNRCEASATCIVQAELTYSGGGLFVAAGIEVDTYNMRVRNDNTGLTITEPGFR